MSTSETRAANRATSERRARVAAEEAAQREAAQHAAYLQDYAATLGDRHTSPGQIARDLEAHLPPGQHVELMGGDIPVVTRPKASGRGTETVWPDGRPFTRSEYLYVRSAMGGAHPGQPSDAYGRPLPAPRTGMIVSPHDVANSRLLTPGGRMDRGTHIGGQQSGQQRPGGGQDNARHYHTSAQIAAERAARGLAPSTTTARASRLSARERGDYTVGMQAERPIGNTQRSIVGDGEQVYRVPMSALTERAAGIRSSYPPSSPGARQSREYMAQERQLRSASPVYRAIREKGEAIVKNREGGPLLVARVRVNRSPESMHAIPYALDFIRYPSGEHVEGHYGLITSGEGGKNLFDRVAQQFTLASKAEIAAATRNQSSNNRSSRSGGQQQRPGGQDSARHYHTSEQIAQERVARGLARTSGASRSASARSQARTKSSTTTTPRLTPVTGQAAADRAKADLEAGRAVLVRFSNEALPSLSLHGDLTKTELKSLTTTGYAVLARDPKSDTFSQYGVISAGAPGSHANTSLAHSIPMQAVTQAMQGAFRSSTAQYLGSVANWRPSEQEVNAARTATRAANQAMNTVQRTTRDAADLRRTIASMQDSLQFMREVAISKNQSSSANARSRSQSAASIRGQRSAIREAEQQLRATLAERGQALTGYAQAQAQLRTASDALFQQALAKDAGGKASGSSRATGSSLATSSYSRYTVAQLRSQVTEKGLAPAKTKAALIAQLEGG